MNNFLRFCSSLLKSFQVNLKTWFYLTNTAPLSSGKIMTVFGWIYFVVCSHTFFFPTMNQYRGSWYSTNAFDTVPHERLMKKLHHYGIQSDHYNWIFSWLTKRTQRVVIKSHSSSYVNVCSGVPQGTVLGPLMFLLYISIKLLLKLYIIYQIICRWLCPIPYHSFWIGSSTFITGLKPHYSME